MSAKLLLIGVMSGTSADGVDAALVRITADHRARRVELLAYRSDPFEPALRQAILAACDPSEGRPDLICALSVALAHQYAASARRVAADAGVPLSDVAAIACHGQTIWHQPNGVRLGSGRYRGTLQIGSPAVVAAEAGVPVVSDFRSADMAAGGQGAPLVPYADYVLFADVGETRAVQNIGGIANVTYLPTDCDPSAILAFDTGPGNMVIDGVVQLLTDGTALFDSDGTMAAAGRPDLDMVGGILGAIPFFAEPPPKSTGRELFGRAFIEGHFLPEARRRGLSDADIVATATALTAHSIALAYKQWLRPRGYPDRVILGGGGVHNRTLVSMLGELLAPAELSKHGDYGIPDDAKEAVAFAILGYETLHGRPSNVPSATGARRGVVLGSITPAPNRGWPVVAEVQGLPEKPGD